jgi:hypothetical protein
MAALRSVAMISLLVPAKMLAPAQQPFEKSVTLELKQYPGLNG